MQSESAPGERKIWGISLKGEFALPVRYAMGSVVARWGSDHSGSIESKSLQ